MNSKFVITALIGLMLFVTLLFFAQPEDETDQAEPVRELVLPELSDADYAWIASRIFQNETGGDRRNLTYWGEGEDFPSFGIGHFIWFPGGVDAPFDETFPAMVTFVKQQSQQLPAWMQDLRPFKAPWSSKQGFDQAWASPEMTELREWLEQTGHLQARFIVSAFEQRWQSLELPAEQKQRLTGLLQQMFTTAAGLFAVIDYFNFKGLGSNPRERYQGEGWGLVQVLDALPRLKTNQAEMVELFRNAAASRLKLRVELSPPDRNEQRWLEGWLARLDDYAAKQLLSDSKPGSGFRVQPYLQNPTSNAITLSWFSHDEQAGQVTVWESLSGEKDSRVFVSEPVRADALAYHPAEKCDTANCADQAMPFHHELRITGLEAGQSYNYAVIQDDDEAGGSFRTPGSGDGSLRFIVYADSETEPESTGKHADWPGIDAFAAKRKYPVDQTTGYAQNLLVMQNRRPAFVAIAGDLVQSGGEQRDWDEFWSQNSALAASVFIVPALGNHEYFGGPGVMGKYATRDSERGVQKYKTYFDLPHNKAINPAHSERYYALNYGAITLLVLDTTNGIPHRSGKDTNWRLVGENEGGVAPDWHLGSEQYRWLEKELGKAQETSRFTFVMFHGAPYSSGVHGRLPGDAPDQDILSAQPIQALTPLFLRYGVDAVFNGHDEMYERSVVSGQEVRPQGSKRNHEIHFYDIGIGGDGLRSPVEDVINPQQRFLAHSDAPEVFGPDAVLLSGGKHYGHLEVNIEKNADGKWQADIDAVYIFPLMDAGGQVLGFERRIYDDSISLIAE